MNKESPKNRKPLENKELLMGKAPPFNSCNDDLLFSYHMKPASLSCPCVRRASKWLFSW